MASLVLGRKRLVAESSKGVIGKLRGTLHNWKLILQRVRRPDKDEYVHATKIMWLAILIVGVVAYTIHLTAYLILR